LCSEAINDLLRIEQFSNTIKNLSNILSPYDIDLLKVFKDFNNCNIFESFVTSIAYQIAIIDLLKLIGIKPDGLIGIGSGEISCAYTDGVIDTEQAIMIAYWCAKCIEYEINHESSNIYANLEKFEAKQKNGMNKISKTP
jgi:fatty acid synthase